MHYSFYQVEDNLHFLMIVEIAIIATSLFVIMIVLFFSSIINQKQINKSAKNQVITDAMYSGNSTDTHFKVPNETQLTA